MLLKRLKSAFLTQQIHHLALYVGKRKPCLGIRRETINAWERRAPLAPKHVQKLTEKGIKVLIQPSNRRAYRLSEYTAAGAEIREDLSDAQLIISVKKVPIDLLIPDKTYAFFSHTIKAQPDNMEMLDAILQRRIRLIDYEKIIGKNGERLVMFGKWAGYAGFIDILHGIGIRLLALGHHTPFLQIGLAHNYRDKHMAVNALRDVGYDIALGNLPSSLGPLIFVFTGNGNVSRGAQELFRHFPHEFVDSSTLPRIVEKGLMTKLYGCVVNMKDHLRHKNGGACNYEHYKRHPEEYISTFAAEVAPYASVIINCIYWDVNSPRLLTIPDGIELLTPKHKQPQKPGCPSLPHRLIAISDISADPGGSIEFVKQCTTIDKPFVIYDSHMNECCESFNTPTGCLVCSIDNMPAQLPLEATEQFGNLLSPYVIDMLNCATDIPFDRLQCRDEIRQAIITDNGKLTPNYKYIDDLRSKSTSKGLITTTKKKRILLLGAGFVSDPVAKYYASKDDILLTICTEFKQDGDRLCKYGDNIVSTTFNITQETEMLEKQIRKNDLIISLLPYTLHPLVAKLCIKNRKHMTTSSYLSPELQALDDEAKKAGVTIMNECGLDPGIDHMLAMDCFDKVREDGGKVTSFVSFCGGLPAPECSDNPLRYKFSWSPKGVLLATKNPARYLKDGAVVEVGGDGAVLQDLYSVNFMPGFNIFGYPNRDSTVYGQIYGLNSECKTLLRGTLRYTGFIEAFNALKAIGLTGEKKMNILNPLQGPDVTWKQLLAALMDKPKDIFVDQLKKICRDKFQEDIPNLVEILESLNLFSDEIVIKHDTPLDTLAAYLAAELAYKSGERDLVILNHDIGVLTRGGSNERHRISLVAYGEPNGFSAMARTVGYTTAIVSNMIIDGEVQRKGMIRPITREVYRLALHRLKEHGIKPTQTVHVQK